MYALLMTVEMFQTFMSFLTYLNYGNMSLISKVTLAAAASLMLGTIGFVHYTQKAEINRMHAGVIKDIERQEKRKAENIYVLQQQAELTSYLQQHASDEHSLQSARGEQR